MGGSREFPTVYRAVYLSVYLSYPLCSSINEWIVSNERKKEVTSQKTRIVQAERDAAR